MIYYIFQEFYYFATLPSFLMFPVSLRGYFFPFEEYPLAFFEETQLLMNSLSSLSSENVFISPSFLRAVFTDYRFLS